METESEKVEDGFLSKWSQRGSISGYIHMGQSTRHTETSQKDKDDAHTLTTSSTGN